MTNIGGGGKTSLSLLSYETNIYAKPVSAIGYIYMYETKMCVKLIIFCGYMSYSNVKRDETNLCVLGSLVYSINRNICYKRISAV